MVEIKILDWTNLIKTQSEPWPVLRSISQLRLRLRLRTSDRLKPFLPDISPPDYLGPSVGPA